MSTIPFRSWPCRTQTAISRASSGSWVGIEQNVRQPTIRRLNTSVTKAVNTNPIKVCTYVKSTTHS